jgi:hypothetical protein
MWKSDWRQRKQDAEDAEYLMGGGRWDDDGDFVAHRPHTICWRYLVAARRRRRPRTKKREG